MKRFTAVIFPLFLFLASCEFKTSTTVAAGNPRESGPEVGTYYLTGTWFEGQLDLKPKHEFNLIVGSFGVNGKYEITKDFLTLISPDGTLFRMVVVPDGFRKEILPAPPLAQPSTAETAPLLGRIANRMHDLTRNPQWVEQIQKNWDEKRKTARVTAGVQIIFDALEKNPNGNIVWPKMLEELVKKGDLRADFLKDVTAAGLVYKAPQGDGNEVVFEADFPNGARQTWNTKQQLVSTGPVPDVLRDLYWRIKRFRQNSGNRAWPQSLDEILYSGTWSPELFAVVKKSAITYTPPGNSPYDIMLEGVLPDGTRVACNVVGDVKMTMTRVVK
ncbi:MAG: hypothetical protein ABI615_13085 [Chthoniobacterales bacterium]